MARPAHGAMDASRPARRLMPTGASSGARALTGRSPAELTSIAGLVYRDDAGRVQVNRPDQVTSLDDLPAPDMTPFFVRHHELAQKTGTAGPVTLPLETSRGCYYKCSFSALNVQWQGIRSHSPRWVSSAVRRMTIDHDIRSLFFVDNIAPANAERIFSDVAARAPGIRFFFEMRADAPRRLFETMRRAGLYRVQLGIEALSTSLLRKFNKRTRCITNLQALKTCWELGIEVTGNLITDHPLSTDAEVEETIRNIALARAYPPPDSLSPFALEVGAPDLDRLPAAGSRCSATIASTRACTLRRSSRRSISRARTSGCPGHGRTGRGWPGRTLTG